MRFLLCVLVAGLGLVPSFSTTRAATAPAILSPADVRLARTAVRLDARHPGQALRWLFQHHITASLGADRRTLLLHFQDGAQAALLPRTTSLASPHPAPQTTPTTEGKALVLAPFAWELGDTGQSEAASLEKAGFTVQSAVNSAVTIELMKRLSDYAVVYIETHSGVLPNGDAILVTGDTNTNRYSPLLQNHSLMQAFVAGDSTGTLYLAITGAFVTAELGHFPPSSLMFVNGCSVLGAPLLWNALHDRGLDTLVSWDKQGLSTVESQAGIVAFTSLASGQDVAGAISAVQKAGLGETDGGHGIAHLSYLGDGSDTLSRALQGLAPPTPTPTAAVGDDASQPGGHRWPAFIPE